MSNMWMVRAGESAGLINDFKAFCSEIKTKMDEIKGEGDDYGKPESETIKEEEKDKKQEIISKEAIKENKNENPMNNKDKKSKEENKILEEITLTKKLFNENEKTEEPKINKDEPKEKHIIKESELNLETIDFKVTGGTTILVTIDDYAFTGLSETNPNEDNDH